jgi:hypothetical protein
MKLSTLVEAAGAVVVDWWNQIFSDLGYQDYGFTAMVGVDPTGSGTGDDPWTFTTTGSRRPMVVQMMSIGSSIFGGLGLWHQW